MLDTYDDFGTGLVINGLPTYQSQEMHVTTMSLYWIMIINCLFMYSCSNNM